MNIEQKLKELFNDNFNGYLDSTKSIKVISESTFIKLIPQISEILSTSVSNNSVTEQKYNELLYAVGRKFPDESRHETALRYILNADLVASSIVRKEV